MSAFTGQILEKGIDLSLQAGVTGTQLDQLVDAAAPSDFCGLIVYGDTGDEFGATGPDVTAFPFLARCLWLKKTAKTLWKWTGSAWSEYSVLTTVSDGGITTAKLADSSVTAAKLATGVVTGAKTNFSADQITVKDIIVKQPVVDPRQYGADNTGSTGSTAAIRKAIYRAAAIGGVVKFQAGTYKIDIDVAYDDTSESTPFGNGGSLCYRNKFVPLIPLLEKTVLTSDGGAKLLLAVDTIGSRYILDGLGYNDIVVENLVIDGNLENQPNRGAGYSKYGGLGDVAIQVGNKATIRNNTIQNFVGCRVVHSGSYGSLGVTVSPYYPQIDFSLGEPFAIIVGSDSKVVGNLIRKHWGGGITPFGLRSVIADNVLEDIAGNPISLFVWQANNAGYQADGGDLPDSHIIYHYLNGKYESYKGLDLGTVDSLNSGVFYGDGESDAVMRAHWSPGLYNSYDKSVYQYYVARNRILRNTIKRFGNVGINLEHALGNQVKDNYIQQGKPILTYDELPFTVGSDGSILQTTGAIGINEPVTSVENQITDNVVDVIAGTTGNVPVSATQKNEFAPLVSQGFSWPLGGYLDNPAAFAQSVPWRKKILRNRVIGKEDSNDLSNGYNTRILTLAGDAGKWASSFPVQLASASPDDSGSVLNASSFQDIVTELEVDGVVSIPTFSCVVGAVEIENPQGSIDALSYEYFAMVPSGGTLGTSGIYQGTRNRIFRGLILRRDTLYKIAYELTVSKRDSSSFKAYQRGKVLFRYSSSAVEVSNHQVESLDYTSGAFEFSLYYDSLLPNNIISRQLQNRVLPAQYRGGIAIYFNPTDPSLYGYTSSAVYALNQNLVFGFKGQILC